MVAYRIDGGRLYYVEHECESAKSRTPNTRHLLNGKVHNAKYVVRMYYIGDLSNSRADVNSFAYMTDDVSSAGGVNAYVNCPLCGSDGKVVPDRDNVITMKESYGRAEIPESPFR